MADGNEFAEKLEGELTKRYLVILVEKWSFLSV
jgi:hypothetical protein